MSGASIGRPLLRGYVHLVAFVASLPVGVALVLAADSPGIAASIGVYAVSVSTMLGVSALYHRVTWSPPMRRWARRVDHATIFLVIAGSYTPWALVVLDSLLSDAVLVAMWVGALVGIAVNAVWISAPKPAIAGSYVVVGLLALLALPDWLAGLGPGGTALVVATGVLSALGAVAYATRRPDPWPRVFGYHEIFHVLVTLALGVHTLAIALFVLP